MATLLELISALPEEAMREGESVTVTDSQGREATITFGKRVKVEPPEMSAGGIPLPPGEGRWHTFTAG